jgi:hypothetical protein
MVSTPAGFGTLFVRREEPVYFGMLALFGLPLVMAFGLVLNFAIPIGHAVALATLVAGFGLLAARRRMVVRSFGPRPDLTAIGMLALLFPICVSAVATPPVYDTGLYHLQAVQWIEHWPRIFGLANLHSRLGFHNALFTADAMLDLPGIGRKSLYLVNHALVFAAIAAMLQAAQGASVRAGVRHASNAFAVAAAVLYFCNPKLFLLASPSYDTPCALMSVMSCWSFLRVFETEAAGEEKERWTALLLLLVSSALALTIKFSAVPFVLLPLGALTYLLHRRRLLIGALLRKPAVIGLALFAAAWLAAGLPSSGCLLFPLPASFIVKVRWSMPLEDVRGLTTVIMAWARLPTPQWADAIHGWSWLHAWPMHGRRLSTLTFLGAGIFSGVVLVGAALDRYAGRKPAPRNRLVSAALGYCVLTALIALAFWFFTAPDLRFATGILATLPALAVVCCMWRFASDLGLTRRYFEGRPGAAIVLCFGALLLCDQWGDAAAQAKSWPAIPRPEVVQAALGPQFQANKPQDPAAEQCWDAPAPCAGGPAVGLPRREIAWGRVWLWRSIETLPARP